MSRLRAPCMVVAAVLVAGIGATAIAEPEGSPATQSARVAESPRHGLTVTLPDGWHRARRNLTPQLQDPREILSVATYPLRYRRGARCRISGCPTPALNGFRATDILLSVQQRRRARPAAEDVPLDLRPQEAELDGCTRGRVAWYAFDHFVVAGRTSYAFVVVGERAPLTARRDLRRILRSLT